MSDDICETRLPAEYDELVPVERLQHGEHNVRRSTPSQTLKRSIERDGIETALVTRIPDTDSSVLHVTDGWQRYQAARQLGWQELPVVIYEETTAALEASERHSIVDEWTTYQVAKHVQSLYQTESDEGKSEEELLKSISVRTARSTRTVERYLKAFQLPSELHPLLKERSNITDADYQPLVNRKRDVKQYDGMSWQVAEELGEYRGEVPDDRLIRVALGTLDYTAAQAKRVIHELFSDDTDTETLQMAHYKLFSGATVEDESRIMIPRFTMQIDPEKREALMDHIQNRRIHLTDAVERRVREFADNVEPHQDCTQSLDEFN